jgi:hypothetical protein
VHFPPRVLVVDLAQRGGSRSYYYFKNIIFWVVKRVSLVSKSMSHLGVVYIMDHEVVMRPSKIYDWLLNLSQDHFSLQQGKKCQSDHGIQGPQKADFKACIIH